MNKLNGIRRLSRPKNVLVTVTGVNGKKRIRLIFPEQKSDGWIQDHNNKFSKPDELVLNLIAGAYVPANSYLEISRLRRLIGRKIYFEWFTVSTETLVETYVGLA